jgi:hypothetical protein
MREMIDENGDGWHVDDAIGWRIEPGHSETSYFCRSAKVGLFAFGVRAGAAWREIVAAAAARETALTIHFSRK